VPDPEFQGFLEKRDAERVAASLTVKYKLIEKAVADTLLAQDTYGDVFAADLAKDAKQTGDEVKDAFTENISVSGIRLVGDLRLVGGKALNEGDFVELEISLPDAPRPVRALALVVWSDADNQDPVRFHAGLFFSGINKQDVSKVARFLILQKRAKHA
jgi:hypothetical protein